MFDFFRTKKNYENLSSSAFKALLNENKNVVLIDVRTAGEFQQKAIKGAINIDISSGNFQTKITQLDQTKTYLLYCRSGNRSGQACKIMGDLGFTKLYNLSGGLMNWTF